MSTKKEDLKNRSSFDILVFFKFDVENMVLENANLYTFINLHIEPFSVKYLHIPDLLRFDFLYR